MFGPCNVLVLVKIQNKDSIFFKCSFLFRQFLPCKFIGQKCINKFEGAKLISLVTSAAKDQEKVQKIFKSRFALIKRLFLGDEKRFSRKYCLSELQREKVLEKVQSQCSRLAFFALNVPKSVHQISVTEKFQFSYEKRERAMLLMAICCVEWLFFYALGSVHNGPA